MGIKREPVTAFDKKKLMDAIAESNYSRVEISKIIGRGNHYIQNCIATGNIGIPSLEKISRILRKKPSDFIIKKSEPAKEERVSVVTQIAPKVNNFENTEIQGYTIELNVFPRRLKMTVKYNGLEINHAWCHIHGKRESDLMQAISYAAHMCYKFSQQDNLEGGVE